MEEPLKKKRGRKKKSEQMVTVKPALTQTEKPELTESQRLNINRRFSAPAHEFTLNAGGRFPDLDVVSEHIDITQNTPMIDEVHFALENHDGSQLLAGSNNDSHNQNTNTSIHSTGPNNEIWRSLFGYLVDSPLLQPLRLQELAKSPLFPTQPLLHNASDLVLSSSEFVNSRSSSSATSLITTIKPAESITSPGSSISGSVNQADIYPVTVMKARTSSGFQFIENDYVESATLDPFILSLVGDDKNEQSDISPGSPFRESSSEFSSNSFAQLATDSKRQIPNYTTYQRKLFSIVDKYGDRLLHLFLTYVNPFLPILSASQINFLFQQPGRRQSDIGLDESDYGPNVEYSRASVIASFKRMNLELIAAIVSAGVEYWELDNELILDEVPDVEDISKMALELIFLEFELRKGTNLALQSGIGLLQACLIICIKRSFDITSIDQLTRIGVLSKTLNIAHSLVSELGLNFEKQDLSADERNFRNNLWWCFYIQEKWLKVLTGKRSVIRLGSYDISKNITPIQGIAAIPTTYRTLDYVQASDLGSLHRYCGRYLVEMVKLTEIVAEIVHESDLLEVEELKKPVNNELHFKQIFKAALGANVLEEKLQNWRHELPSDFSISNEQALGHPSKHHKDGYLNAKASLQLSYFSAVLIIHKGLLKRFSNKYMNILSGSDMKTNLLINDLRTFETKFNNLKLNAIKVSIDCSKTIKNLKLQDLNGFWYLFINFKLVYITNFYILLHMVVDKTSNDLNPTLPISTTDLAQSANYNNNLQFKSTMQKILADFRVCIKHRSTKWKFARLANDLFKRFKGIGDIDILENYGIRDSPEILKTNEGFSQDFGDETLYRDENMKFFSNFGTDINFEQKLMRIDEPEPLSLDEDISKYDVLTYEDNPIIV